MLSEPKTPALETSEECELRTAASKSLSDPSFVRKTPPKRDNQRAKISSELEGIVTPAVAGMPSRPAHHASIPPPLPVGE